MKTKTIIAVARLSAALALGAFASGFTPATTQDWEVADAIPGGALGNTIIQLPDGSILNTLHILVEGDIHRNTEWVTRWKPNGGETWETIDYWPIGGELPQGGELLDSLPYSAASHLNPVDGTIEVYVVGLAYENDFVTRGKGKWQTSDYYEVSRWVVRRGIYDPAAASWDWTTVRFVGDDWGFTDRFFGAYDVAVDAAGVVYVAGRSDYDWVIEASHDGGETWQESDRWRFVEERVSYPRGLTVCPDGSVLAVGYAAGPRNPVSKGKGKGKKSKEDPVYGYRWITRKLDPATRNWSVVDDFVGHGNAGPDDITVTSDGIVLAAGVSRAAEAGSFGYWMIRGSLDYGTTWDFVDEYQEVAGSGSNRAYSITEGPDGTVYVGGIVNITGEPGEYTAAIRSSQDLINWSTELLPVEWRDLSQSVNVLAAKSDTDGGPYYLYCSEAGPNPDGALIRKLIIPEPTE